MTAAQKPKFLTTGALAERLHVSRVTIFNWRTAGYLPPPDFSEGKVSLWDAKTIAEWQRAGAPWANVEVARQAVAIDPEIARPEFVPSGRLDESPRMAAILDEFEALLNATPAGDVRAVVDALAALRLQLSEATKQ